MFCIAIFVLRLASFASATPPQARRQNVIIKHFINTYRQSNNHPLFKLVIGFGSP